jgi:hypothetical protein
MTLRPHARPRTAMRGLPVPRPARTTHDIPAHERPEPQMPSLDLPLARDTHRVPAAVPPFLQDNTLLFCYIIAILP